MEKHDGLSKEICIMYEDITSLKKKPLRVGLLNNEFSDLKYIWDTIDASLCCTLPCPCDDILKGVFSHLPSLVLVGVGVGALELNASFRHHCFILLSYVIDIQCTRYSYQHNSPGNSHLTEKVNILMSNHRSREIQNYKISE